MTIKAQTIDLYLIDNGETPDHRKYLTKEIDGVNTIVKWDYKTPEPTENILKPYNDEYNELLELRKTQRARKSEYPPIGDQLDAIMKWAFNEKEIGLPDELVSLAAKCMSVKAKHPKPDKKKGRKK